MSSGNNEVLLEVSGDSDENSLLHASKITVVSAGSNSSEDSLRNNHALISFDLGDPNNPLHGLAGENTEFAFLIRKI